MPTRIYIYKGARPSDGARNLKDALDATILRSEGSTYRGRANSAVINWGTTNREAERLQRLAPVFLNRPEAIRRVSNKLHFFQDLRQGAPELCIPFCTNFADAAEMARVGGRIYCRTVLNGHSGEGIKLLVNERDYATQAITQLRRSAEVYQVGGANVANRLGNCELFTAGISGNRKEFRIHVVRGRVILRQVKLRQGAAGEDRGDAHNTVIRNLASGWIYGVNTVDNQPGLAEAEAAAIRAVELSNLDFGAVDVIFQTATNRAFVLEINTAPGLAEDGSALEAYANAFREVL